MRSKVIKNKGHLNKAWVVWQVNKWTTIWTRTMYTCLSIHVNFYFHIFHLKMKTDKNYYHYFWLKSKFNWLWYMYFFIFLFESIASFSRITIWKFILKLYIMYLYWKDFIIFLLPFTINSIPLKWNKKCAKLKYPQLNCYLCM